MSNGYYFDTVFASFIRETYKEVPISTDLFVSTPYYFLDDKGAVIYCSTLAEARQHIDDMLHRRDFKNKLEDLCNEAY